MHDKLAVFILLAINVVALLLKAPYCLSVLIWSDEFDGQELDQNKWSFYTGSSPNHELQAYTNRSENVYLQGGHLVLKALDEKFAGHNYTSGRIDSRYKGDFLYTTVKVRAKLPFGQGLWPAIWMLPSYYIHGPGIASGEMDIMELLGDEPNKTYTTCHYGKTWTDRSRKGSNYSLPHGDFSDDFHEFSVNWSPNLIRFYVDNVEVLNFTHSDVEKKYTYPFDDYFYIILNVAVGGDWPGPPDNSTVFPQVMEVDYVRVYN